MGSGSNEIGVAHVFPDTELVGNDLLDLVIRERIDVVVQLCKRVDIRRWHQIRPARKHLTDLYEGWPERLQILDQALGLAVRHLLLFQLRYRVHVFQRGRLKQVLPTVLEEQRQDTFVARQLRRIQ